MSANDDLADFLSDWCVVGPGESSPFMPLFDAHKEWAARDADRIGLDRTTFGTLLRKRFDMKRVGQKKVQTYIGLRSARADEIAEREAGDQSD